MDLSAGAVEQAIIGTVKTLDKPIRPSEAVGVALTRRLSGETPEVRSEFRRRLMATTGYDIRRAAELLRAGYASSPVCVFASREKLTAANESLEIADL